MDKATPAPSPASVDSVMALAQHYAVALLDLDRNEGASPKRTFNAAMDALRAEVERLAAQSAPTVPVVTKDQRELIAKLRYMGKQYAAGQFARGGVPQKHYLEEAADEIEMMAWALSMKKVTPASAQENADLRNVIQAACIDGLPGLARAWEKYFPDHPITIKAAEVERLAAQAAPTEPGGDVEPVAWGIFANNGNIRFWACDKASADSQAAKTGGDVEGIFPASTVAALKSRADALAARVAELEKDARRLDAVERNRFELTPLEGGGWDVSQYHSETCDSQLFAVGELTARAAIDSAALAAKG